MTIFKMTTNGKRENYAKNHEKVEDSKIKVNCLMVLEKKPLQNYFEGTTNKKKARKKSRTPKTFNLNEFTEKEFQSNEEAFIESIPFYQREECKEKGSEDKKLENKIKIYQRVKEHEKRHNQIKQRLKEENFLEQLENLAETWCEIIKRNKSKQLDGNLDSSLGHSYFQQKRTKYNSHIEISLLSKKFWDDEGDCKKAPKNKITKKSGDGSNTDENTLECMRETFLEKLVFLKNDDEDKKIFHTLRC